MGSKASQPPAVVTVVLKVGMHCEACAQVLQKRIRKIPGVESAMADLANDQKTRKQASIVKEEEKKEEEKKEGEKKEGGEGEKKEGEEGKGGDEDKKTDIKKSEYWHPNYAMEYAYPPQIFSDENPNACSVILRNNHKKTEALVKDAIEWTKRLNQGTTEAIYLKK
ncbi:hypothetical protein HYC85_017552 [Camellia sinensis]|uniref:HMA domain-containing protein n=1 Tax=Camellia sinensis TaxID=4442 RepID=A0A7J7GTF6_CAMSI|nr:hypothetical protein HYC85_017552 [Camellia sinensis]